MQDTTYNIILTGELRTGVELSSAISAFSSLFKISDEKVQHMLAKVPTAIKQNIDAATAQKFQSAIERTGFVCELQTVQAAAINQDSVNQDSVNQDSVNQDSVNQDSVNQDSVSENVRNESSSSSVSSSVIPEKSAETFKGLTYKIEGRPDYSFLTVQIPANETLKVEASAMATMDTHLVMKTKLKGGFGRFLTGESLFVNDFTAERAAGEIGIAPGTPGDVMHQYVDGQTIFLQNSAYVASTTGVNLETKWQGMMKGFFSGESFFLIRCSGKGDLWFNSYGAIIEIDVEENYVVDTSNIVGFTEGLEYQITKVGGYKSLFFSGEGFVCRFTGKGKVWIQTRSAQAFTGWAHYFRPVSGK